MKKLLLSAVALVVLAIGPAVAADLSRKAPAYTPPPPPPQPVWTGWYVGANAGVHWFQNNHIDIGSTPLFDNVGGGGGVGLAALAATGATVNLSGGDHAGFIGGAQFGRNQQWGNWVFGSETDIQGISNNKVNFSTTTNVFPVTTPLVTNINATKELTYLGTTRGRFGWLATPTFLVYGTGGLAYGGVKSSVDISQFHGGLASSTGFTFGATSGLFDQTLAGWTAGGGVEWLFLPNWSAKVEYLYYDLGNVTYTTTGLAACCASTGVRYGISSEVFTRFNGNIVRAGLNYHFNF